MIEFLLNWKSKILSYSFPRRKIQFPDRSPKISITLYDTQNINQLDWPTHSPSIFTKKFFSPLVENGVNFYIDNLKTDLKLLNVQGLILPVMINDNEYDNSYVCSPYSFYISYALDSLNMVKYRPLKFILKKMLGVLGKFFRHNQFNKVIHVNNLPFSTNVYPSMDQKTFAAIIDYLKNKFPEHTIIFRSLNDRSNVKECQSLKNIGASLIASRQVYLLDTKDPQCFLNKTFKKDLKYLKKTDYEVIETHQLTEEDIAMIVKNYENLYIHHYSTLNPKFNERFIRLLVKNEILDFKAIRKNGQIDGVFGYFCYNDLILSPILGYNRELLPHIHLYELLSTLLILEAKKNQQLIHLGAGASSFKKNRKAKGYLEYMAVYHKHLPLRRRIPWILLKGIIHLLGIYYMKKY